MIPRNVLGKIMQLGLAQFRRIKSDTSSLLKKNPEEPEFL